MASGALPPAFPAIEIDGGFYWDGRLVSNTPLGQGSMNEHWASGLNDIRKTLAHGAWLELPPEGVEFVTHDAHRLA